MTRSLEFPELVRMRAESQGESGRAWLAKVEQTAASLARDWSLELDAVLEGGSESLVIGVTQRLGGSKREAVLKIGPDSADLGPQADIFRLADGEGYATLYDYDADRNALLLERLGTPLEHLGFSAHDEILHLCDTLHAAWRPLVRNPGLMSGADKAVWLDNFIRNRWQRLGRPCSEGAYEQALTFAEACRVRAPEAPTVLVHGDAHHLNALLVPGETSRFKFVDPDGLFAEPACDLAVPMREYSTELLAGDTVRDALARARVLADRTGADEEAIWQWGFVERISTGLVMLEIGMTDEPRESFAVAERLYEV